MVDDRRLIDPDGAGLEASQIVPLPDIQSLPNGKLAGGGIAALVDGHGSGLHLLPDRFLRLAGEGALYLPAGARIAPSGDAGFPVGVRLAIAGDGFLPDGPRAFC